MQIIHIIGRQNNGKTTLMVELLKEIKKRGLRVGTVKHSSHAHELDKPGKDSFRHREAGGLPAAVVTKNQMAVYFSLEDEEDPFNHLAPLFKEVDMLLVEGHLNGPGKKIEVWRKKICDRPLCLERNDIEAVITDDDVETGLPILARDDINKITDYVCKLAGVV